jgi:hypothetical protein
MIVGKEHPLCVTFRLKYWIAAIRHIQQLFSDDRGDKMSTFKPFTFRIIHI